MLLLQDWLDRTLQFEADAKDILSEEVPDSKKIEKFLETGLNLDIDLLEIPQLKQVTIIIINSFFICNY